MSNFTIEEWYKGEKCTIYTVLYDGSELGLADLFFEKYLQVLDENIKESGLMLLTFITNDIAKRHSALETFFREEREAIALPGKKTDIVIKEIFFPLGEESFPLRLYCYRVNDNILILFNGGIKTDVTAQDSPDLSVKFQESQIISKKIQQAINDGDILVSKNELLDYSGSSSIYL
ncbi:hypothetical protein [Myroides odoratimimus]|uniref:hypothetical protein n=1 Tax=Myroides odoratimimus TaxID=76832 RepID=UPI0031018C36